MHLLLVKNVLFKARRSKLYIVFKRLQNQGLVQLRLLSLLLQSNPPETKISLLFPLVIACSTCSRIPASIYKSTLSYLLNVFIHYIESAMFLPRTYPACVSLKSPSYIYSHLSFYPQQFISQLET